MSRIVYVNGNFLPEEQASVSIFDRGYVFGDGVYEVATVLDGKLVDSLRHKWRLENSLQQIGIPMPLPWTQIEEMERELVRLNNIDQGLVYFQVTRGQADRHFHYEGLNLTPTLTAFTQEMEVDPDPRAETGVSVASCPDIRWHRRDIKSIALLGQVIAKQTAKEAGAYEAVMLEDGYVTEGASSSIFMINERSQLLVRPGGGTDILPGLTRLAMLELAEKNQIEIVERRFSLEELIDSKEAFLTSATTFIMPITTVDGVHIRDGKPGPITLKLRRLLINKARDNLN